MKKEDIEFLKHLSEEFRTQNDIHKLHQADPMYFGIMTYYWVATSEGCGEEYRVIVNYEYEESREDFADSLIEDYGVKEGKSEKMARLEIINCTDTDDLQSAIREYFSEEDVDALEFTLYEAKREGTIASDAMFLTCEDALRHLEANKHHYSEDAHIYAMTAFRSPSYERLHNIIKETDWDALRVEEDG